jgi:hypothetical protein
MATIQMNHEVGGGGSMQIFLSGFSFNKALVDIRQLSLLVNDDLTLSASRPASIEPTGDTPRQRH